MAHQRRMGKRILMRTFYKMYIYVACAIVALVFLMMSGPIALIGAGERGFTETFGQVSDTVYQPGLALKWPLLTTMHTRSLRQQSHQGELQAYSSDLQTMKLSYTLLYQFPESQIVNLYKNFGANPIDDFLIPKLENELKQTVSHYPAEEVVKSRDTIIAQVRESLKKSLLSKGGSLITINDIPIKNIDLSEELEKAIEKKQVKQQEALAQKYELEKAEKQAEMTVVKAEAEAKSIRITAAAITQNPKIIELELVKKWDGKTPETIVAGANTNLLLPGIKQ